MGEPEGREGGVAQSVPSELAQSEWEAEGCGVAVFLGVSGGWGGLGVCEGVAGADFGVMDEDKVKALAEEHWEFLEKWFHLIFVDGFVHGYKHGREKR